MITNTLEKGAEEIYETYKTIIQVEKAFDTYKNVLTADRSYMKENESIEGWLFVNHMATMIYYNVLNKLKEKDLQKKMSKRTLRKIVESEDNKREEAKSSDGRTRRRNKRSNR